MDHLNNIFHAQEANRWIVSKTTVTERRKKLLKLKEAIISEREEIKEALYIDFKKPHAETELTEIHMAIEEINFAISRLKKWMKPKRVCTPAALLGSRSFIQYEAKGVVLILAPWNYPFSLLINPLVAAVAAGNCVMARPSEKTPATGKIIKSIIEQVFPQNEVAVTVGEIAEAEYLSHLPFDHIFFTGSTNVGRKIMAAASKNLTPVTLELGGKSPVIIDSEVDLKKAVERIVWGKFLNAGQTCVAPDYVLVPEFLKASFVELFKEYVQKYYGETGLVRFQGKDFARIIDLANFNRLSRKIENELRIPGDENFSDEYYMAPTLLPDVNFSSPIMEDEIFGPVLPLLSYKNHDEVISYIQKNPKPLALYIFSDSKKTIKRYMTETTSGGVGINQVVLQLANPYLPFGGIGPSGIGSYHGEFGFKNFSHEKAVLRQGRINVLSFFAPPFSGVVSKWAYKILRFLE